MNRTHLIRLASAGLLSLSAIVVPTAHAAVVFSDSFDRPDNHDIDAVSTGIVNNTGTSFAASSVYSSPWVDPATVEPAFGAPDGVASNGGGQQVLNGELQKYNPGTANLFINHNFVNASISTVGGFTVSLDVNGTSQSTFGQGATIALGMSLAEAQAGNDANDGNPAPFAKYSNAFQDTATAVTVLSDFYLALRGNGTLAWGSGNGAPTTATVGSKTGTISATLAFNSFAAGSPVSYTVYYNNVAQGAGSFNWSGTGENYIGLDARDSTLVRMDNLSITVVPEPAAVGLSVVGLAFLGTFARRRQSLSGQSN